MPWDTSVDLAPVIVGIDASNIRAGGGVTHIVEFLRNADPVVHGFDKVRVWAGSEILSKLENKPWLEKASDPMLDKGLFHRTYWQWKKLAALAADCDLLFVPGGSSYSDFSPMVTMNRNLIPFEWDTILRFGVSWTALRFMLLRSIQTRTMRKADGAIFLTRHAHKVVSSITTVPSRVAFIPHGVDSRFFLPPRPQAPIDTFSHANPFRVLYVSIVEAYKHHREVVAAVSDLQREFPISLDLVGPPGHASKSLQQAMSTFDSEGIFVRYIGTADHKTIQRFYQGADLFVFASSCEAFGQILVEAMASGLPIACSNRSSMHELIGHAALYFDPEQPHEISAAIREYIQSPSLRAANAESSFQRAQQFSWRRCSDDTFQFLASILQSKTTT